CAHVAVQDHVGQLLWAHGGEDAQREFGSNARDAEQFEKERALGGVAESVQVERFFPHVEVCEDFDRVSRVPHAFGGPERNVDTEPHAAADFDDKAGGRLHGELSAQKLDHDVLLADLECKRWQNAMASASAASAGLGTSRSMRCDCMSVATCSFEAPPRPTAAFLTRRGAYSSTGMPRACAAT